MTASAPPLVGFNNNVRYRGMRFHIQTEDSGVTRPHIITHLFADGGYVIKSVRTDYSEYVDRPDRPALIQRLMREQHRAMALDLRDGRLDAKIDNLTLSAPPSSSEELAPPSSAPPSSDSPSSAPPTTASRGQTRSPKTSSAGKQKGGTAHAEVRGESKGSRRNSSSSRPPSEQRRPSQPPTTKAGSSKRGRPSASAILQVKPGGDSIFGTLPQESLDDVILSYVSHSKNGPTTRRSK